MANGLFMTPQQVAAQQQAQGQQLALGLMGQDISPLAAPAYGIGTGLGNAIGGLFGADVTTPQQREAQAIQQAMQDIDFSDPQSVYNKAKQMNDAGYTAQALQLLNYVPKAPEEATTWSQPQWLTGPYGRQVYGQINNFGEIKKLDAVSPPAEKEKAGPKIPTVKYSSLNLSKDEKLGEAQFWYQLPTIGCKRMLSDSASPEDYLPVVARQESYAQQLMNHDEYAEALRADAEGRPPRPVQGEGYYMDMAQQLMAASADQWIGQATFGGGKVDLSKTTPLTTEELVSGYNVLKNQQAALEQAAGVMPEDRDPRRPTAYSPSKISPNQAYQIVNTATRGTVGDVAAVVENMGYQVDPQEYTAMWSLFREYGQEYAQPYLLGRAADRSRIKKEALKKATDANNYARWAELKYMFDRLDMFKGK